MKSECLLGAAAHVTCTNTQTDEKERDSSEKAKQLHTQINEKEIPRLKVVQ